MAKSLSVVLRSGLSGLITKAGAPIGASAVRGSGRVYESFAGAWQAGVQVDPIGTLTTNGAVFACITRIANDIAKLNITLRVLGDDNIAKPVTSQSPYWSVIENPNPFQNRIQFLAWWMAVKLLHGNAYFLKQRDARNLVARLFPLDPRKVTPLVTRTGDVYYQLTGDDLAQIPQGNTVPASEIVHDRMNTLWHPLMGVSPLYAAALSATMGGKIQNNSSVFFKNMSRPSGILSAPGTIDDVTAARLKQDWEQNYSAENIGRLAVLGDGLKYDAMTIPAQTAQLIEQLGWVDKNIASVFQVPGYKIGVAQEPPAGSVAAAEIRYLNDCLQIHVESIELCLKQGLEIGSGATRGYDVELDLDGLLRMDGMARAEMLTKASGGAYLTPNEARAKDNLPKADGGDQLYKQHQDYSLAALAKRDARDDPFASGNTPAVPAASAPAADPAPAAPAADPAKQADDVAAAAVAEVQKSVADVLDAISAHSRLAAEAAEAQRAEAQAITRAALEDMRTEVQGLVAKALPAPAAAPIEPAADDGAAFLRAAMAQARKVLSHAD